MKSSLYFARILPRHLIATVRLEVPKLDAIGGIVNMSRWSA